MSLRLVSWGIAQPLWKGIFAYFLLYHALDAVKIELLIRAHKGNGFPILIGSSSASDAMDVVVSCAGHIVIDDHLNVVYINTTREQVGGHDDVDFTILEGTHDLIPLFLVEVRMHGHDIEVSLRKCCSQIAHLDLGRGKDDDTLEIRVRE